MANRGALNPLVTGSSPVRVTTEALNRAPLCVYSPTAIVPGCGMATLAPPTGSKHNEARIWMMPAS